MTGSPRVQFANILLSGRCNLRCPACVGRSLPRLPPSMDRFPLPGLSPFLRRLGRLGIREISLTGLDAEPQLYPFEPELLLEIRAALPGARVSLHTNGTLLLRRLEILPLYDRVSISYPSFDPETYRRRTGGAAPYDLGAVLAALPVPAKISTLLDEENLAEVPRHLSRCRELGVRRLVLRCRDGWSAPPDLLRGLPLLRCFGGNPVHDDQGMEVSLWDFRRTTLRCLNLLSDGRVSDDYRLDRALRRASAPGAPAAVPG